MSKKEEKVLKAVLNVCKSLIKTSEKYFHNFQKIHNSYIDSIKKLQKEIEKIAKGASIPLEEVEAITTPIIELESFTGKEPETVFEEFIKTTQPTAPTEITTAAPSTTPPPSAPPATPPAAPPAAPPKAPPAAPPKAPPSAPPAAPPAAPTTGVPSVAPVTTRSEAASITELRNAMLAELNRLKKLFSEA